MSVALYMGRSFPWDQLGAGGRWFAAFALAFYAGLRLLTRRKSSRGSGDSIAVEAKTEMSPLDAQ
jgi:hypothetical protein